jgi:hypothetical protein
MGSSRRRNSTRAEKARSIKPSPNPRPKPGPEPPAPIAATLTDIRRRLEIVRAIAYCCSAALCHQDADADMDVSLVLQRSIGDELDRQIERLDQVLERKP